jgi:hypothetical protein
MQINNIVSEILVSIIRKTVSVDEKCSTVVSGFVIVASVGT